MDVMLTRVILKFDGGFDAFCICWLEHRDYSYEST
jgi:hypothetical protein